MRAAGARNAATDALHDVPRLAGATRDPSQHDRQLVGVAVFRRPAAAVRRRRRKSTIFVGERERLVDGGPRSPVRLDCPAVSPRVADCQPRPRTAPHVH